MFVLHRSVQNLLKCIVVCAIALMIAGLVGMMPASVAAKVRTPATSAHHPHILKINSSGQGNVFLQRNTSSAANLTYNGGATMQSTSTNYAIFWEPPTLQDGSTAQVSPTYNSLIQQYFTDIGGSGLYNINTQYFDTVGHIINSSTLGGVWVDTSPYPPSDCTDTAAPAGCLSDTAIQNEIVKAMSTNSWTSSPTHLFFVFTAKGEGSCYDNSNCSFTQYCAYHSYFPSNGQNILYANMPYMGTNLTACGVTQSPNSDPDADSAINVISHEHMEAVTDPFLNAWYDQQGAEIGDKCAWNFGSTTLDGNLANVQWNNHYYLVQQEWSNATSNCELALITPPPPPTAGSVFFGSKDGYVYAVDNVSGKLQWRYKTGNAILSSPALVNGVLYTGSTDGAVYALNSSDGTKLWSFQTAKGIYSAPTVANGVLYISSRDGNIYALNTADGSKLWSFQTTSTVSTSPTLANGVVYATAADGSIYALDASLGTKLWRYQTQVKKGLRQPPPITYTTPVVVNNVVYLGASDGYIYLLDAGKGTQIGRYLVGGTLTGAPTIVNNIIYTGSSTGYITALNAGTGSRLWRYQTWGRIDSTPTVVNNVLYIGTNNGFIFALNASKGSRLWWYWTSGSINASPAVVNGVMYIGSSNRYMYAISLTNKISLLWRYLSGGMIWSTPAVVLPQGN